MRDPKRISIVLKAIKEIWAKNPDLRLGQLICNVARDPVVYYLEDDELVNMLYAFYSTESSKVPKKIILKDPMSCHHAMEEYIGHDDGVQYMVCVNCGKERDIQEDSHG